MKKTIISIIAGYIAYNSPGAMASASDEGGQRVQELQTRLAHVLTTEVRSALVSTALWPHVQGLGAAARTYDCDAEEHVLRDFFSHVVLIVESNDLEGRDMCDMEMVASSAAEFMPLTAWHLVEEFCRATQNFERVRACDIMSMTVAFEKLMPLAPYYTRYTLAEYPKLVGAYVYQPPYEPPVGFLQSLFETMRRLELHQDKQGAGLIACPIANVLDKYFIQREMAELAHVLATEQSIWIKQRIIETLMYHPTREALALYEKHLASAYPDTGWRARRRNVAQFRERVEQQEARLRSYSGSVTCEVQAAAAFAQQQAIWDAQLITMPLRTLQEADLFETALIEYETFCRDVGRSDQYRPTKYADRLSAAPMPALKNWYWRVLTQCMHRIELKMSLAALTLSAGAAFGAVLDTTDIDRLIRLNNMVGTWDVIENMNTHSTAQDGAWRGVTKLAVLSAFDGLVRSGSTNVAAALARRRDEIFDQQVRECLEPFAHSPASAKQ